MRLCSWGSTTAAEFLRLLQQFVIQDVDQGQNSGGRSQLFQLLLGGVRANQQRHFLWSSTDDLRSVCGLFAARQRSSSHRAACWSNRPPARVAPGRSCCGYYSPAAIRSSRHQQQQQLEPMQLGTMPGRRRASNCSGTGRDPAERCQPRSSSSRRRRLCLTPARPVNPCGCIR